MPARNAHLRNTDYFSVFPCRNTAPCAHKAHVPRRVSASGGDGDAAGDGPGSFEAVVSDTASKTQEDP